MPPLLSPPGSSQTAMGGANYLRRTCVGGANYLRLLFFQYFLMSSWHRIFSDFGANLAPTCPPTWSQNPSKIVPRGIQNPSQLASCFRSPFGSIFDRFLVDFRCQNPSKINQKSIKKSTQHNNPKVKNARFLYVFCYFGHVILC